MEITIKSRVIKGCMNHDEYFQIRHTISYPTYEAYKRVLTDCQHFETRKEALASIPEMERDLKESLEKGLL
jgi:hypothetical protein